MIENRYLFRIVKMDALGKMKLDRLPVWVMYGIWMQCMNTIARMTIIMFLKHILSEKQASIDLIHSGISQTIVCVY